MSRSVKKGPFAAPELLKRVDEMNKAGEKKVFSSSMFSPPYFPTVLLPAWPRNVRVGANSPSLCPTMSSVT